METHFFVRQPFTVTTNSKNFKVKNPIWGILNCGRQFPHAANRLHKDAYSGDIIGVKCNCGKLHPVENNVVDWEGTFDLSNKSKKKSRP